MTDSTTLPVRCLRVEGVTFRLWIVRGEYQWRSEDGQCRIGQNTGNAMWWARCGEHSLGAHFQGLKPAMLAAARARQRRAA